jgi:S-disulfanyl-L-cysteine oxidoreductase SoxD
MNFRAVVVTLAATAALGAAVDRSGVAAQATKTNWDAIYSDAQATRGEELYVKKCGSCHGAALEGSEMAPPLVGPDFNANWDNLTVGELVERMRTTMPQEDPGSLSRAQNADLMAYMLRKAGAPAGPADLPGAADALNAIKYKAQKPEAK